MAEAEKIKDVLGTVMRNLSSGCPVNFRSIWKNSVDEDERRHSSAADFSDGKLTVVVDNSVHLQELTLKREKIRKKINMLYPDNRVSVIRFKIGKIED